MIKNILSPYQQISSLYTDIQKLKESNFNGNKAVMLICYDSPLINSDNLINLFELVSAKSVKTRIVSPFEFKDRNQPNHDHGRIICWELK